LSVAAIAAIASWLLIPGRGRQATTASHKEHKRHKKGQDAITATTKAAANDPKAQPGQGSQMPLDIGAIGGTLAETQRQGNRLLAIAFVFF
jgi:hypothetical protein